MNLFGILAMSFKVFFMCIIACLLASVEPKSKLDYETRSALAKAHFERVLWKVMCSVPQPRVFKLGTEELSVMPHATILHRCGESTGCCNFSSERCVAKSKEQVTLFAFVRSRYARGKRRSGKQRIKKFVFTNHTECHCESFFGAPR